VSIKRDSSPDPFEKPTHHYQPPPDCEVCDGTGVVIVREVTVPVVWHQDGGHHAPKNAQPQLANLAYACRCSRGKKGLPALSDAQWRDLFAEGRA